MKKSKLIYIYGLFFFFLGVACPQLFSEEANSLMPVPSLQAVYVLSEHLPDADAVVFIENKESRKGSWKEDRFSFYGLPEEGDIRVIDESGEGQAVPTVQMNALPGLDRFLQFPQTPSGSQLAFYYKTKLKKPSKQNVYIYIALRAGKKQLARFRVTCNDEGWQKISVPLGIARLLNRPFPLTVQVISDKKAESSLRFYAEIID